jgi:amino acid transporter
LRFSSKQIWTDLQSSIPYTLLLSSTWIALGGTIGIVMPSGGPVAFLYGFIFCVLCNFALAASLGELAAIWPTAGGQYHFVFALSPDKWKALLASIPIGHSIAVFPMKRC